MKACAFEYVRARDVAEAVKLLVAGGDGAMPMAGTQSLGPMLNLRLLQPSLLVDLRHIEELRTAQESAEAVTLGACVTHAEIEDGRVPDPARGFMREIASNIAYRAVRNRGTIGGSLVHADPAADWPSALTLLGATALIAGPAGRREMPVEKFITGLFETALESGEILVAVRVPKLSARARCGYWKFCRKAGEFPQAIGGALDDPEHSARRLVIGATRGAPHVVADAGALIAKPDESALLAAVANVDLGGDSYSRRLHAVALRRAIERLAA
jgi:carbon-monoxide dehydrogenase medium subunit